MATVLEAVAVTPPHVHFSGHETFPLRQLWLRKAYDAVLPQFSANLTTGSRSAFAAEDAIVRFGVGKNMVNSIRHWALATEFIAESPTGGYHPTDLADSIFSTRGLDPFCEHPSTTWIVHWKLTSVARRSTTWWWVFNCIVEQTFDKPTAVRGLSRLCRDRGWKVSESTLVRDVDVCLASYVPRATNATREDAAEPILAELSLIQAHSGGRGLFTFKRGPKRSLSPALFAYAVVDYWSRKAQGPTVLPFDTILHEYGSPGRVFKLDEVSVAEYVQRLDKLTDGALRWSDTSGVRQVHRIGDVFDGALSRRLLGMAYE
jgi:hypothetical protein